MLFLKGRDANDTPAGVDYAVLGTFPDGSVLIVVDAVDFAPGWQPAAVETAASYADYLAALSDEQKALILWRRDDG